MTHIALAIALGLGLAGCQKPADDSARAREHRPAGPPPVAVAQVLVERRVLVETIELTGTLEAERRAHVASRIAGRLAAIPVEMGDRVARGQTVARLDDAELRERVTQAEAALAIARAGLQQRDVDVRNLERQTEREQALAERDFVSREVADQTQARLAAARAQRAAAEAELARAGAALREGRSALAHAVVAAPLAGIVVKRLAEPGTVVGAGAPLAEIVDPSALKVAVKIPEIHLATVGVGTAASLSVAAWPQHRWRAVVRRISPVVSPDTRQVDVELAVRDPVGRAKPGMIARVSLGVRKVGPVSAVPREAVLVRGGQEGVFQVRDGVARFVPVRTGLRSGLLVALVEGPRPGERIVTGGGSFLQDGSAAVYAGEATRSARTGRRR